MPTENNYWGVTPPPPPLATALYLPVEDIRNRENFSQCYQ